MDHIRMRDDGGDTRATVLPGPTQSEVHPQQPLPDSLGSVESRDDSPAALFEAIRNGNAKLTRSILESGLDLFDERSQYPIDDSEGSIQDYITVAASSHELLPVLEVILEHVKKTNRTVDSTVEQISQRAFLAAVDFGNNVAIPMLFAALRNKFQAVYRSTMERALRIAAGRWSSETVKTLIQMDNSQTDKIYCRELLSYALLVAVFSPSPVSDEVCQLKDTLLALKGAGADVYTKDGQNGYTILHHACAVAAPSQAEIVQMLLEPEIAAHPRLTDNLGQIPLYVAVKEGDKDSFHSIVAKSGTLNGTRDHEGNTPLHFARVVEEAKLLVEFGCDIWAENQKRETALHRCCRAGAVAVAEYLLKMLAMGVDMKDPDIATRQWSDQHPTLSIAARRAAHEKMNVTGDSELASKDVSRFVNARTNRGWTPILLARGPPMMELLLRKGADITARTELGWTALHCAVDRANPNTVDFLLQNVDHKSNRQDVLMARAKSCPWRDAFYGDDRDYKYQDEQLKPLIEDETPLHWAVIRGNKIVEQLLSAGKEAEILTTMVEATDSTGATPLIRAIASNGLHQVSAYIVRVLIANGASPSVEDNDGHDAFWWAKERGWDGARIALLVSLQEQSK